MWLLGYWIDSPDGPPPPAPLKGGSPLIPECWYDPKTGGASLGLLGSEPDESVASNVAPALDGGWYAE